MTTCSICKRPLGREEDPLSVDCGGDCLACIIAAEDDEPAPVLPPEQLRAWIEGRDRRMAALWDAAALASKTG